MTLRQKELVRQALVAAMELRANKVKNLVNPICVYDLAEALNIDVRFADIPSLEGMYSNAPRPAIILGSDRPAGRRVYTCGHELGHHRFGHGTRVDEIRSDATKPPPFNSDEFLVQSFSGFLLMPKVGVCNAFATRRWRPSVATPEQIYRISNLFGVTYAALVHHMTTVLGLMPQPHAEKLLNVKLKDIRAGFVSDSKRQLLLIDTLWQGRPLDLEVEDLVLTPLGTVFEGPCLRAIGETPKGLLLEALQPGHGRLADTSTDWATFVRVSRRSYVGRSIYRHLEEVADE